MQLIGFALLLLIVWFGFHERVGGQISLLDLHALAMVLGGSVAAVLISATRETAWSSLLCLRELVPGLGRFRKVTRGVEAARGQFCGLWQEGKRSQALLLAEQSPFPAIHQMADLLLHRASTEQVTKGFAALRNEELHRAQPPLDTWEMLSKLGPSFGMVGTITGMIQMFRNMSADNMNIGAAMSLALIATLYGVAFGAGVAGPIGHFLGVLLDERLRMLERCEESVGELLARTGGRPSSTGISTGTTGG